MRARAAAVVLTAALVVYLVLLAGRAWLLVTSGDPVAVLLGAAVLALPLLGVWMVVATWRFGARTARLGERIVAEGGLPDESHLPTMPSGRIERDAADEFFAARRAELDEAPGDWRSWFKLARAYDLAGDRRRAREAMRRAVDLERGTTG
ncbi:hypothetical protein C1701_19835 [Actinoalloteichus sp. AHMU CJ021]|uniref:Tetratricopeptide repeat protein n=2 Tax=Actinoalloteichus cyanogriseus TaxID=2893586 RepID=A0ABT1JS14_ACTCY|nr:hypothetical protein [Actinoalloteichus caeruleus]AUS80210.1 hypothetical protein C1701_19835 [Actinoalloteichus sp. AHMU CJ021]MCP2334436.1 hypothetical protein [Actinoalloteichus caeruleus DSM 43889]